MTATSKQQLLNYRKLYEQFGELADKLKEHGLIKEDKMYEDIIELCVDGANSITETLHEMNANKE